MLRILVHPCGIGYLNFFKFQWTTLRFLSVKQENALFSKKVLPVFCFLFFRNENIFCVQKLPSRGAHDTTVHQKSQQANN